MIRHLTPALAAFALASVPIVAAAAISPGTQLSGTIDQNLDSGSAQVGQSFTMSHVHSQSYDLHDATIYGHVSDVQRAGQGTPGKIELAFDKLHTASGNSYAISGRVVQADVKTKSNLGKEVVGAVVGDIVGNYVGKHVGTNLGGLVGAAGGYLYARNNKTNVSIPQNSQITMQVLQARRQAGSGGR